MSQAGTILEAYKEAVIAQKEKRYLKAARLYRIANLAFENADVPDWGKVLEIWGKKLDICIGRCIVNFQGKKKNFSSLKRI